jgi:glycosyltransferase involved in cell wall biosynthesis
VTIAVVIAAYNAEPYLDRAFASLAEQSLPADEVVVVDDGSTDRTAEIAAAAGARVVRQERRGPAAARNRGVEEAKSDFVAFLDADDWFAPEKLRRSVQHLKELHANCVGGDAWLVRDERVVRRRSNGRRVPPILTHEHLIGSNPIACSSVVARRRAVLDAGGFDGDPELFQTEDYDLWLRMAHREPIAWLAQPLTFCRAWPLSLADSRRCLRGIDLALDKVQHQHAGEAHFQNLILRRRSDARLEFVNELLAAGKYAEAELRLGDAGRFRRGVRWWRAWLACKLKRQPTDELLVEAD